MVTDLDPKLQQKLAAVLGSYDALDRWWDQPLDKFNNRTPAQIYKTPTGKSELNTYISSIELGAPYYYKETK